MHYKKMERQDERGEEQVCTEPDHRHRDLCSGDRAGPITQIFNKDIPQAHRTCDCDTGDRGIPLHGKPGSGLFHVSKHGLAADKCDCHRGDRGGMVPDQTQEGHTPFPDHRGAADRGGGRGQPDHRQAPVWVCGGLYQLYICELCGIQLRGHVRGTGGHRFADLFHLLFQAEEAGDKRIRWHDANLK